MDFKLFCDKKSMKKLIGRLKFADFTSPEPNPWKKLDKLAVEWDDIHNDPKVIQIGRELGESLETLDVTDDEDDDESSLMTMAMPLMSKHYATSMCKVK